MEGEHLVKRRRRMVDRDLRGRGIHDPAVLEAMSIVPREAFVDDAQRQSAYEDHPLPIGDDQTISQPFIVGYMAQELRLRPTDRVLDVGTGSGYAAAVMARLVSEVWSIERHQRLADGARDRLATLGIENVHVIVGDGTLGHPSAAPYDAISVAASTERVPEPLIEQLADGGRLVIPVGSPSDFQHLVRYVRNGKSISEEPLLGVRFVPLVAE